jgi:hypothetical protein
VHYHPDIVLMMFRREKPTTKITKDAVEAFDQDLFDANDGALVAACNAAGVDPMKFERSRVLGLAVLSLGGTGKLGAAARAFKAALDEGIIG